MPSSLPSSIRYSKEQTMTRPSEKTITSWPPKPPVIQVTREQLKSMTPDAINQAREAGALTDVLSGKKSAPPEAS